VFRRGIALRHPTGAQSLRLPEGEAEQRLRSELAVALYAQGILSFGKSSEPASLSRYHFGDLVARRGIPRHYGEAELAEDQRLCSS